MAGAMNALPTHRTICELDGRPLVVASAEMRAIVEFAAQIGASDAKVLITGESGVGKDLVARLVHDRSPRAHRPFVAVNCAGIPDTLAESELFGHVRGSFTGAYRDKAGQFQLAHGGTLFLDEIGELSARTQALLLRFLENGEYKPVGADCSRTGLDVRVVAATNRNLDERVLRGEFREDLLYRLRVIQMVVPPLRDRPLDLEVLVEHFLSQSPRLLTVSDAAWRLLRVYHWPGNVRELRNVIEQTVALVTGDEIEPAHLPASVRSGVGPRARRERRRQVADELYQALVSRECSFWDHVHPLFLTRDMTRRDLRELVRRGLTEARGNYRAMLTLFGMPQTDYKKFLNFLTAHDCTVDFRPFRSADATWVPERAPSLLLPARGSSQEPSDAEPQ
jgi:transcriptional regulator with PAS, ATPase and Fis domain